MVGPREFLTSCPMCMFSSPHVCQVTSVVFNSVLPHGLQPASLLCPWNCPGKNTGAGCHSLLQGIFLTQGSNSQLLNCRQILYSLNHQGSQLQTFVHTKTCIHICCCSVAKLCLTLCDTMDCSMPGFSVLHCFPKYAQIYVH